jgi:myosin protein heavy chain
MAKERAERDQKEREALEELKMRLESDKQKVEGALAAERALGLDKDALLERSKKREVELEDEVAALQADLDTLDSQLDRVLTHQKESDEKHEALKLAFDQAAEHLVRLEAEQRTWAERDVELAEQLNELQAEGNALREQRDRLEREGEELKNVVLQREEDLARSKERMDAALADYDRKVLVESSNRYVGYDAPCYPTLILWAAISTRARSTVWSRKRGS